MIPSFYRPALVFVFVLTACSSGKKAFDRGDYYDAVIKSVNRIRRDPGHSKSLDALTNAYPLALQLLETQAQNTIASNDNFKWKNVINSYNRINTMYEEIRQCPGCLKVVKSPKNYYAELGPLKEKAAEESYIAGINDLMKGTRNDAKTAYFNFKDVQYFSPGYKDVIEYLEKSKFEATLKVILEQIRVPGRYELSNKFFQDNVEEFVHTYYTDQTFIKFYTPQEADAVDLPYADQIVNIQFDDFSIGNTTLKEKVETFTKDSVIVGDTRVDGKFVPVYATVKAKYTSYRKEIVSSGLLSLRIEDAKTHGVLTHRKFPGGYAWFNTWARFNGDERALTEEQIKLAKQAELQPPAHQTMFMEFTEPLYAQLVPAIRTFYQNY